VNAGDFMSGDPVEAAGVGSKNSGRGATWQHPTHIGKDVRGVGTAVQGDCVRCQRIRIRGCGLRKEGGGLSSAV
jgi:hypothetical protein